MTGHGTRRIEELSPIDVGSELLATALRTSDGLTHELWGDSALGSKCSLWDLVNCSHSCEDFIASGVLVLNSRDGLSLSSNGLKLADHVVPFLLANLFELTRNNKSAYK